MSRGKARMVRSGAFECDYCFGMFHRRSVQLTVTEVASRLTSTTLPVITEFFVFMVIHFHSVAVRGDPASVVLRD